MPIRAASAFSELSSRKWELLSLDKPEFLRGDVGAAKGRQAHSARKHNEETKKTNQENKTLKKSVGIPNRNDSVVTINVRRVRKAGFVKGRSATNLRRGFNRGGNDANNLEIYWISDRFGDGVGYPDGICPRQKSAHSDAVELRVDACAART
jgi:hypothetical protein